MAAREAPLGKRVAPTRPFRRVLRASGANASAS